MPYILKNNPKYEDFIKNYNCSSCGLIPEVASYKNSWRQRYKEHHGAWPQNPKIKVFITQEEADRNKTEKKASAAVTDSRQLSGAVNGQDTLFDLPADQVKQVLKPRRVPKRRGITGH